MVLQDVRTMRQASVTQHRRVILAFIRTGGTVTSYSLHTDSDGDYIVDSGERFRVRVLPTGTRLSTVALTPVDTISFEPSGTLRVGSTGGVLVLNDARNRPDTLLVTAVGHIIRQD
jgi:hypothetical protein